MIRNQIVPEIEVIEKYTYQKKQKRVYAYKSGVKLRHNNRKCNRSRNIQVIKFFNNDFLNPAFKTKEIKTFV